MKHKKLLKKFLIETINKIPGHIPLNDVQIWFQDEARFGQRNTTTRIWAEKGTRPLAIQQQQFESAYLFGAVCINTGETEAIVSPLSNMEAMQKHLALISSATPCGKHAVIIMDQASWHQSYLADEFKNLIPITVNKWSKIAPGKGLRTRQNFLVSSYSTIKNSNAVIKRFNKLG
ncbi:transposase [Vibrio pelagius]|uniref:transposase n=1 Tax=Vibrio pelagius TaxID=28169 RepID=UPI0021C39628|nr:transposase [Vibrio pelagius]